MNKRIAIYLLAGFGLALVLYFVGKDHVAAATKGTRAPERKVNGATLVSERDPKVRIELPQEAQYLGADRWVLYDVADCELHAFVEADAQKNVRRLYWVQFEGYVPEKPRAKYEYDSPRHVQIGGMDFFLDTWARPDGAKSREGSDREHIEAMIHAKGFKMLAGMVYARLVHLPDQDKRKELMIIYGEALPPGMNAVDLDENGKDRAKWPAIESAMLDHAKERIRIRR